MSRFIIKLPLTHHASQAVERRSAAKSHEHGFKLVIGVVGNRNVACRSLMRDTRQRLIPKTPRIRGHVSLLRARVDMFNLKEHAQAATKIANKRSIFVCRVP
jgi:hypothetical protein